MRSKPIRIALAGLAGYGETYVNALLGDHPAGPVDFAAAAEPDPERVPALTELRAHGIRIYPSLDALLDRETADLVINCTPIHLHHPLTLTALEHGAHVLCEKPAAATIQDALSMQTAGQRTGRWTAIGYQWSFCPAIQALKRDIAGGMLGRPIRLKTLVLWPRAASYYRRSAWAGADRTAKGEWVLDSPMNNAAAHYLHNMLYVLGDRPGTAASPTSVEAELYRANPITNADTAMLRVRLDPDVEMLFYTSHAVRTACGPRFEYTFERGTVRYDADGPDQPGGSRITAHLHDGRVRDYGRPDNGTDNKLFQTIACIRDGMEPTCTIGACLAHTRCVNGAQESAGIVHAFDAGIVRQTVLSDTDTLTWVDGLEDAMHFAYANNRLPADLDSCPWARQGNTVDLDAYNRFPSTREFPSAAAR